MGWYKLLTLFRVPEEETLSLYLNIIPVMKPWTQRLKDVAAASDQLDIESHVVVSILEISLKELPELC